MSIKKSLLLSSFWLLQSLLFAQSTELNHKKELDSMARACYVAEKYTEALSFATKNVAACETMDSNRVKALYLLALVYNKTADYNNADAQFGQALLLCQSTVGAKSPLYLAISADYAYSLLEKGDYPAAEKLLTQAVTISKSLAVQGGPSVEYASLQLVMGELCQKMGNYPKGEASLLEALKIYEARKLYKNDDYARCLNTLALLYFDIGNYVDAEQFFTAAVAIKKTILGEQNINYATSINDFARFYQSTGNYTAAASLFQQAAEIYRAALGEKHPFYATTLSNLAVLYRNMKNYTEAEVLLKKALSIQKNNLGEKHPDYARSLNNLAVLYKAMGKFDAAEAMLKEALSIKRAALGNEHLLLAPSLNVLATLYQDTKKPEKAIPLYLEAFKIRKAVLPEHHPDYLVSLHNLAIVYRLSGDYDAALSYIYRSFLANSKSKDSVLMINNFPAFCLQEFHSDNRLIFTLYEYHNLLRSIYDRSGNQKDLETAYSAIKATIKISDRVRKSFSNEKDKLYNYSEISKYINATFKLGLYLNKNLEEELFTYAEFNKSTLLADAFKSNKARTLGDLPDTLILQESDLKMQTDKLKKEEMLAKTAEERQKTVAALNALNTKIESFKKGLKNKYPKYHALKYEDKQAKAKDIQRLLDDKTLFLEYFVADSMVYLFTLTKNNLRLFPLKINKTVFAKQIKDLRQSLSDYQWIKENEDAAYTLYSKTAYWFYTEMIAPALVDKNIDNLIIVTDGELGHIPFESFLTAESVDKKKYTELPYLLHRYKISYNYSALLWKENKTASIKNTNGKILAAAAAYNVNKNSSIRSANLRSLRDALDELPAAKEEVSALSKLFAGIFLQESASNEHFFKENAHKYGIIHLAMHGLMNERFPVLSSLAFTENGDSTEDNFLEAWEISHLKLNAQLVVLSACETGYGKFQQGEGVMSLARSFMYAGVPSLVVSLWQVNDASTSTIMQLFYKNLAKGMDKAEALRQAKLEYIKVVGNPNAAHPAYWAAFVIIGDSRPIAIATKGSGTMWWIVGGICLLALGGAAIVLRRKKTQ